jgi:hypothetical protein
MPKNAVQPQTMKVPPFLLRAAIIPTSLNESTRTVDVCFGSEAAVRRPTWEGWVDEILSFDPAHVRMERMNSGAPFLNNHQRWGKVEDNVLGVIEKAWIDGGKGYATVRFSKREAVNPVWEDLKDGILRNVSVGYNVFTYEKTEKQDGPNIYRAVDWEPAEISTVPVPADINAQTRSASGNGEGNQEVIFQTVNILNSRNMEPDNTVTNPPNGGGGEGEQTRSQNPPVPPTPPTPDNGEGQRSQQPAPPTPPTNGDVTEQVRAAIQAERQRSNDIRSACQIANLPDSFADGLIGRDISVSEARAAIFAEMQRLAPNIRGGNASMTGPDETDRRRSGMADAILHRCGVVTDLDENARRYRGMTLVSMARHIMEVSGESLAGRSDSEVSRMVFGMRAGGMLSTSDFPEILGNTVNRSLRAAYDLAPRTFMPFCRRTTNRDFREKTVVQLSQLVKGFDEIVEGGEYTFDQLKEAKESYRVKKYGKKIAITWETLINDDLDAFSRIPMAIANQAAQKQNDIVWSILTGSTTMGDNVALFHTATHGNLASSGAAINNTSLGLARAAMRKQKDLNGKDFINVQPSFLIVGPDKETEAEAVIHGITYPTADSDVNVWKNKLKIIVEPRITGNVWYLAAMPSMIDTIEYAFLEGEGELFTEQKQGFDVDGIIIKARMVFGAKAIDWKGFYKNPGA